MAEVAHGGGLHELCRPVTGATATAEARTGDEGAPPSRRMKAPTPRVMGEKAQIADRL
ncbi:MAG: hypothetical protein METHAR1v1_70007 [Methanothrix sp.]|jgi:hypothetical protein|nr:MAG: hypothetical protein METHAR1v1_70007 [Methanothrix sp.]